MGCVGGGAGYQGMLGFVYMEVGYQVVLGVLCMGVKYQVVSGVVLGQDIKWYKGFCVWEYDIRWC